MYYTGNRVVIVDFNHIAFNMAFGGAPLHSVINGESINTSIPNGALKNIMKWSNNGKYPTVVCFDRPCPVRKGYFAEINADETTKYKGSREKMPGDMFKSITLTENLLRQAGVKCLAMDGYEADDLIYAAVKKAKQQYPNVPIDIVTGDSDMLPLVDEQVSVFLRSRKGTFAEFDNIVKNKYVQVTPRNYRDVVEGLSAYKDYVIPYNYILLLKLMRGDDSDNVPGNKKLFPPRKVKEIITNLTVAGYKGIRYGDVTYSKDNINGFSNEILELVLYLRKYCSDIISEEGIQHIVKTYKGINLNQPFIRQDANGNYAWARQSISVADFGGFSANALVQVAKQIGINVKIGS